MKKRLFITLTLIVLTLALAGCSKDSDPSVDSSSETNVSASVDTDVPTPDDAEATTADDTNVTATTDVEVTPAADVSISPRPTCTVFEDSPKMEDDSNPIYWNEYPDGVFDHNVNSKVYRQKNTWVCEDDKWYYQNQYGIRAAGWLDNNGKRYYMEPDGSMYTGWKYVGGANYYFDLDDGHMLCSVTKEIDETKYSFDREGRLQTEMWVYEKEGRYYIDGTGARCRNGFFFIGIDTYYAEDGFVVTGNWVEIDGYFYYFYEDGHMAKNTFVGDDEVDYLGHLVE